jgi:site-specific DNA-methyltransferase (adenine-specific)
MGLAGQPPEWNRLLMNLRKRTQLKHMLQSRITSFPNEEVDKYSFSCEIAVQTLAERSGLSLDGILCDPTIAAQFDREVFSIVHQDALGLTPLKVRWAALGMRKRLRSRFKNYALRLNNKVLQLSQESRRATIDNYQDIPSYPGIYLLQGQAQPLYVGETRDLRSRIERHLDSDKFNFWDIPKGEIEICHSRLPEGEKQRFGQANQSLWIGRLQPRGNYQKLAVLVP